MRKGGGESPDLSHGHRLQVCKVGPVPPYFFPDKIGSFEHFRLSFDITNSFKYRLSSGVPHIYMAVPPHSLWIPYL